MNSIYKIRHIFIQAKFRTQFFFQRKFRPSGFGKGLQIEFGQKLTITYGKSIRKGIERYLYKYWVVIHGSFMWNVQYLPKSSTIFVILSIIRRRDNFSPNSGIHSPIGCSVIKLIFVIVNFLAVKLKQITVHPLKMVKENDCKTFLPKTEKKEKKIVSILPGKNLQLGLICFIFSSASYSTISNLTYTSLVYPGLIACLYTRLSIQNSLNHGLLKIKNYILA